jgi:hypothetical protein
LIELFFQNSIALSPPKVCCSSASTLTVGNMNMNDIAFEEFIVELTLWYLMAAELLREDPVLRAEFSGQVELASFMQWQSQRLLKSAE